MKVKKSVFIGSLVACSMIFGVIGAGAANGITKIQAALNANIKFKVDGNSWVPKDGNGNKQSALIYNGTTYLPLRSTAEALGVTLSMNNQTQVISLDSGSASGIPYNDVNASSTSSGTGSSASPSSSPSVSSNAGSSTSSSSDFKILAGTDAQVSAKLREQAVTLIRMYGDSLLNGQTTNYKNYLSKYVSTARENSLTTYGDAYWIDKYAENLKSVIAANSASTIKSFAKGLQDAKVSDVEEYYIGKKNEFFQSFEYSFVPKDFGAFSTVYVEFVYEVENQNSTTFILSKVTVD